MVSRRDAWDDHFGAVERDGDDSAKGGDGGATAFKLNRGMSYQNRPW